ncbi:MAG: hypothetical protein QGG60_06435 [Anaerolineales bacterium]|nr:hypothetical protein [Anaerolineales bacterium]
MPEYEYVRLQSGLMKANQITGSGASIGATTRANCQIQLSDLNEFYGLHVKCVSVTELVADALVMNGD